MGKRIGCFGMIVILLFVGLIGHILREKALYESYSKMLAIMEAYQPIASFVIHMQNDLQPQIAKYKLDLNTPPFPEIDKVREQIALNLQLLNRANEMEVDRRFVGIKYSVSNVLEKTAGYLNNSLHREALLTNIGAWNFFIMIYEKNMQIYSSVTSVKNMQK